MTSSVFLKNVLVFFIMLSLLDRCQIVTNTCKNNVLKFVGSLLNHLYQYTNVNFSVKPLSLICITTILTMIYLLKNCSLVIFIFHQMVHVNCCLSQINLYFFSLFCLNYILIFNYIIQLQNLLGKNISLGTAVVSTEQF